MLTDEYLIKETLKLAEKGRIWAHPNPMVGAILVKNDTIIERGYHHYYGGPHAEIDLLTKARESAKGGTLYVNLEPCCHYGKTGPCTNAIIDAGIKEIIIGDSDPNPIVNGKGVSILRKAGINVRCGILKKECRDLNQIYYKYNTTGMPYVSLKIAMTLDGKISYDKNKRTTITGPMSQKEVHRLRAEHDAVLIGSRTAYIDNPQLTVRLVRGRSPIRVILDSHLDLPLKLELYKPNSEHSTIVVTTESFNKKKYNELVSRGIEVLTIKSDKSGRVSIPRLLKHLANKNISSILVEGGSEIFSSFFLAGIVDKYYFFIAPKIFCSGLNGFTLTQRNLNEIVKNKIKFTHIKRCGEDILIETEVDFKNNDNS